MSSYSIVLVGEYNESVAKSFLESLAADILELAERGAVIGGCAIGIPGMLVGGLVGAVAGCLKSLVGKPLAKLKPLSKVGSLLKKMAS